MKIFAIGRNYAEHAKELGNEVPAEPVIFMKPATALLSLGQPFTFPTFSSEIHYEIELVLRVCGRGKDVPIAEASHLYNAVTVGIDFTARDVQTKCKAKGLPWEIAKSFDGSAAVGEFVAIPATHVIEFSLLKNGVTCQHGRTTDMLHGFDALVHHISRYFSLEPGDLVFTGTPAGVGPIAPGDILEGFLGVEKLLEVGVDPKVGS